MPSLQARRRLDRLRGCAERDPADRVPVPPDAAAGPAPAGRRPHAGEGEATPDAAEGAGEEVPHLDLLATELTADQPRRPPNITPDCDAPARDHSHMRFTLRGKGLDITLAYIGGRLRGFMTKMQTVKGIANLGLGT